MKSDKKQRLRKSTGNFKRFSVQPYNFSLLLYSHQQLKQLLQANQVVQVEAVFSKACCFGKSPVKQDDLQCLDKCSCSYYFLHQLHYLKCSLEYPPKS